MNGIFDVKGENKNPLNGNEYSDAYKNLATVWSNLPCYESKDKFINLFKINNVVLVTADTGSGKTVLVPKFALHTLDYKGKILITLPKKNITESAAKYAAETLDVELGNQVGFQYRGKNMKSDKTNLLYSTDGSVISMFKSDPLILEYDIVIIDEAHERKIQIDLLLYLIKNAIKKRSEKTETPEGAKIKPLKLIIMSATIDDKIFEKYYNKLKFAYIHLSGKPHLPIKDIFLEQSILNEKNKYIEKGKEIINQIIKTTKNGDIIFFVTTISECEKTSEELSEIHRTAFCMALFSGFPRDLEPYISNQNKYKELNSKYTRRIFIATNMAESSLTIDGITYVVDSGLEISVKYNPTKQINAMQKGLITNAQIRQRRGRTGRTNAGYCYHLYTQTEYDNNAHYPESEILKSDLKNVCLSLLKMNNNSTVEKIIKIFNKFIEPPKESYINDGINYSIELGLIDKDTQQLSPLGNLVVDTRLDINDALSLLYAFNINRTIFKKTLIIIIIQSLLKKNIDEFFYKTNDKNTKNKIKQIYNEILKECNDSEHVLLYKLYEHSKINELNELFNKKFIENISLLYKKQKNKLFDLYKKSDIKIPIKNSENESDNIIMSFNHGYQFNIAHKKNNDFNYNGIEWNSSLSQAKFKYEKYSAIIFYSNIFYNKRLNISIISPFIL